MPVPYSGSGGSQPSFLVLARSPKAQTRGRSRAQTSRGCRTQCRGASGDMVLESRGTVQKGGGSRVNVMIFKGILRPSL